VSTIITVGLGYRHRQSTKNETAEINTDNSAGPKLNSINSPHDRLTFVQSLSLALSARQKRKSVCAFLYPPLLIFYKFFSPCLPLPKIQPASLMGQPHIYGVKGCCV